jgi:hypothetical protein
MTSSKATHVAATEVQESQDLLNEYLERTVSSPLQRRKRVRVYSAR